MGTIEYLEVLEKCTSRHCRGCMYVRRTSNTSYSFEPEALSDVRRASCMSHPDVECKLLFFARPGCELLLNVYLHWIPCSQPCRVQMFHRVLMDACGLDLSGLLTPTIDRYGNWPFERIAEHPRRGEVWYCFSSFVDDARVLHFSSCGGVSHEPALDPREIFPHNGNQFKMKKNLHPHDTISPVSYFITWKSSTRAFACSLSDVC